MIKGNTYPRPFQKVWAAAYTDGKVECFEIRTVDRQAITPYYPIWHKEYPLGTAYADFLYTDLSSWDKHLDDMQQIIDQINHNTDEEDVFSQLWAYSSFWLKQSPLFAPVVASIEGLRLTYEAAEPLTLTQLRHQVAYYRELQPKLFRLAETLFETDEPSDMERKYTELWRTDKETFPQLSYGKVYIQEVWRGGTQFLTYDNLSDIMNAAGTPESPQEFFTTEVISSQEPEDLVNFLLVAYMKHNLQMKPCKYCGRYFGTKRSYKTDYCDRLIDGSKKTCREAGAFKLYERKTMEDPAIREYKRSYKAHNARIRYGIMTREEFSHWSLEARKRRDLCIQGKLPLEEFVAWLDNDKR